MDSTNSCILYQNGDQTVTVLDIPMSIQLAQAISCDEPDLALLSCPSIDEPYPVRNEPKSAAARQRVDANMGNNRDNIYHDQIQHLIAAALADLKTSYKHEYCLPRVFIQNNTAKPTKRKRVASSTQEPQGPADDEREQAQDLIENLPKNEPSLSQHALVWPARGRTPEPRLLQQSKHDFQALSQLSRHVLSNPHQQSCRCSAISTDSTELNSPDPHIFRIPPLSTFLFTPVQSHALFTKAASSLLSTPTMSAGPGQFDFILLDPPWPNASAKRAHSYQRVRHVKDVGAMLQPINLELHLAPQGLLGIWITNKASIRDYVLGKEEAEATEGYSLFDLWNLELQEEWIWVKTTSDGEPITSLSSTWRKPYEILLLGRPRPFDATDRSGQKDSEVKRRIIIGVPDLHSRKPCLKELVEPIMPDAKNYCGLEIFARHLTAGWWSWGDEVLKFNWSGHWKLAGDDNHS